MNSEQKKSIYTQVESEVDKLYNEIKAICNTVEQGMFVNKIVNHADNFNRYLEYNLELVVKRNLNSDDYGVIYAIKIEEKNDSIVIDTEIFRSFGQILYSQKYFFSSLDLGAFLNEIKGISAALFSFVED